MGVIKFIDLFAGIGGLRQGMENQGFECVFSSEFDVHAQKVYKENYGEKPYGDITLIDEKDIPDHNILLADFPCQPFSISGKKKGFEDTRGTLFFDVLRIAAHKKPSVIVLENVKNLIYHDNSNTLTIVVSALEEIGYKVSWRLLNAKDFGVPQNRERIIIVASKYSAFDFDKLETKPLVHLKDFLDKDGDFEYLEPNEYTLLEPEQIKVQKSGLIFCGYLNKNQRKNGVRENTSHLSRSHKQPYRIYSIEGTHPTISSQETSGRFYIYNGENVRKLTLNECIRLMGFNEGFKLLPPTTECYKRIGNSVCVPMIEEIAKQIKIQTFDKLRFIN